MSLFDDLLAAVRPRPEPRLTCLIIGCDEPQVDEGLCAAHNRDVVERDPLLDGFELPE